ncbi:hypothetical protein A3D88_03315 [Candidatus Peribacteria bacterium RIFCSPHIGHO2_02_FULL_52_16]|nr:MAG: hypothetical protein A2706_04135 [Candidatus Peribacteria bacterium RIFCSPHIGHO2_01_FULL_51_35]OGJ61359.1 MAG: hypothetical protein A3D88_03315 [Candidatus Peribacteria bacterium RIFCSPHIGHO2_02_FULL_52_16]
MNTTSLGREIGTMMFNDTVHEQKEFENFCKLRDECAAAGKNFFTEMFDTNPPKNATPQLRAQLEKAWNLACKAETPDDLAQVEEMLEQNLLLLEWQSQHPILSRLHSMVSLCAGQARKLLQRNQRN